MRQIVFIGMETSGVLRRRFHALGYNVISCDLLPSDDNASDLATALCCSQPFSAHMIGDVFQTLDLLDAFGFRILLGVFHPTCTYHTVAGAWAFSEPDYVRYPGVGYHQRVKPEILTGAARHVARFLAENDVERIKLLPFPKIIENPKGTIPTRTSLGKPVDIVQPYEFGDDASKATCLWAFDQDGRALRNFKLERNPLLYVQPRFFIDGKPRWGNQSPCGAPTLAPSVDRWKERSRTFDGIGNALVKKCVDVINGVRAINVQPPAADIPAVARPSYAALLYGSYQSVAR